MFFPSAHHPKPVFFRSLESRPQAMKFASRYCRASALQVPFVFWAGGVGGVAHGTP